MKRIFRSSVLFWLPFLFLGSHVLPLHAQDNPYKIDNTLYPYYQRAFKIRDNSQCLLVADTLYEEALKKGDLKAQCLAYVIPVCHYSTTENYDSLTWAVERCRRKARENNYLQYYYYASSCQITWLLNHDNTLNALQLSEEMKKQALADHDDYGIVICLRHQGYIYQLRKNEEMAANRYLEALEYMQVHCPEQDPTSYCLLLSEYNRSKQPPAYEEALRYTETALKNAKSYENRMNAMLEKCFIMYYLKRLDEFNALYNACFKEMAEKGIVQPKKAMTLRIYKTFLEKDYDLAYRMADSVGNIQNIYELKRRISLAKEDYQEAYRCSQWLSRYNDSIRLQIQSADLAELTIQLDNERVKQENKSLALKKARLELFISLLACLFCFLVYFFIRRRRMSLILKKKNKELDEARNKAEAANQMKSFFIHNMSHEIRTPLNAIVGFSQILTAPDMEIGAEDKKEFGALIHHNAELLTTLINDILDLAALESGKYAINLEPLYCNELCHSTLFSVKHRNPEGVELRFTTEAADDFQIVTDEKRLRQVLTNFLTNSMKHTERGEILLHCSLSENPGKVTFSVADTGTGVPADKVDSLFGRFAKLNNTKQGTGLGLNICRVIAERLGGEVGYDRNYTGGARFLFILPLDTQRPSGKQS